MATSVYRSLFQRNDLEYSNLSIPLDPLNNLLENAVVESIQSPLTITLMNLLSILLASLRAILRVIHLTYHSRFLSSRLFYHLVHLPYSQALFQCPPILLHLPRRSQLWNLSPWHHLPLFLPSPLPTRSPSLSDLTRALIFPSWVLTCFLFWTPSTCTPPSRACLPLPQTMPRRSTTLTHLRPLHHSLSLNKACLHGYPPIP